MEEIRSAEYGKSRVLYVWESILDLNYYPIFGLARELLSHIPAIVVPHILKSIFATSERLVSMGVSAFQDMAGKMFQRLITDRKFLATYYTLPELAYLLAELALSRLDIDWADLSQICALRVADFACGTGALLAAVQRSIYRRHRRYGGNDAEIHQSVMEDVLVGTDIMPAGMHLTASILSSARPGQEYRYTNTLLYGDSGDNTGLSIGALDLLAKNDIRILFGVSEQGVQITAKRSVACRGIVIPHNGYDVVIRNSPFTRTTNHEVKSGRRTASLVPAFRTTGSQMRAMSKKLSSITRSFGHGNAGLASDFMDLADRKLKVGGVMALVIPFSFVKGKSWEKARGALDRRYEDVRIVAISAAGSYDRVFSSDTGMAECLVIATKKDIRNGFAHAVLFYEHRASSLFFVRIGYESKGHSAV